MWCCLSACLPAPGCARSLCSVGQPWREEVRKNGPPVCLCVCGCVRSGLTRHELHTQFSNRWAARAERSWISSPGQAWRAHPATSSTGFLFGDAGDGKGRKGERTSGKDLLCKCVAYINGGRCSVFVWGVSRVSLCAAALCHYLWILLGLGWGCGVAGKSKAGRFMGVANIRCCSLSLDFLL